MKVNQDLTEFLKQSYRPKKIAVCTGWSSPFMWTHNAFNTMNLIRPEGIDIRFLMGKGRDPARRHMWGVKRGLEWGATHICFLGADQLHPLDILLKFVKHIENGWPAVCATVPTRGFVPIEGVDKPFVKLVWKWKKDKDGNIPKHNMTFDALELASPKDGDLQEVAVIGSGAMMFDVNLLLSLIHI